MYLGEDERENATAEEKSKGQDDRPSAVFVGQFTDTTNEISTSVSSLGVNPSPLGASS